MSPTEIAGLIGALSLLLGQVYLFWDGKRKVNDAHVKSIEDGFGRATARQDKDLDSLHAQIKELRALLEKYREHAEICEREKMRLETRLLVLEERGASALTAPQKRTDKKVPPAK